MISLSSWFPSIASWLKNNISNISEFNPGKEYKVFSLSGDVQFSAPICFDIFAPEVVRGMVKNGSNLVVNLSNLAWFGRTTASDNMIAVLRWRAIENRVPVVFASNNGQSIFIGPDGLNMTKFLKAPDLIIYLKADFDTLINRIEKRSREYEATIDPEYLKRLNEMYNQWIDNINWTKVLVIDTNSFNIFEDQDKLESIFSDVRQRLG